MKLYYIKKGMTLLELALTMTIILTIAGTVTYYYNDAIEKSKVSTLKQILYETRKAIDEYYKHNNTYPQKLEDLTLGSYKYLRSIPIDPTTNQPIWIIIKENGETAFSNSVYTGTIYDIRSTNLKYYNF